MVNKKINMRSENNQTGGTLHLYRKKMLMLQSCFPPIRSFILVTALLIWVPVIEIPDIVLAQQTSNDSEIEEAISGFDEEDSGIDDTLSEFDEEE